MPNFDQFVVWPVVSAGRGEFWDFWLKVEVTESSRWGSLFEDVRGNVKENFEVGMRLYYGNMMKGAVEINDF